MFHFSQAAILYGPYDAVSMQQRIKWCPRGSILYGVSSNIQSDGWWYIFANNDDSKPVSESLY